MIKIIKYKKLAKGTSFAPMPYTATETKKVYFCGCRQGANIPLCNGDHKKLDEDSEGTLLPVNCLKHGV